MLTAQQKAFLKCLDKLERGEGLRQYEAYCAFLELAFCAMAKAASFDPDRQDKLEARYMEQIARFRHAQESAAACKEALGHLVEGLEAEPGDFLGVVHMELGGNPHTGQFFTPWSLARMMAEMTLPDADELQGRILSFQEPACGCGAMVLAYAEALKKRDIDPARDCHFDLVDVDLRCVQAAYIQCSLMGISATVFHGNTLSLETWGAWHTITAMMHPKWSRIAAQRAQDRSVPAAPPPELPISAVAAAAPPHVSKPQPTKPLQLSLLDF